MTVAADRTMTVLVVDDDPDTADTTAAVLAEHGFGTRVARNGEEALAAVAADPPDAVLLDIGLPDISGYEAARRIRKLEGVRQPTLIALTGWGQQQDKLAAAEAALTEPTERNSKIRVL